MGLYKKFVLPWLQDSVMSSAELEKLRPAIIGQARGVVLEIGAGTGLNFPFYKRISRLYALEPSRELIALARPRAEAIGLAPVFLEHSAEKIPLADNSVDTVVSTWTLCSIGKPKAALQEIVRVLRPGGRFVFLDHGISPRPLRRFFQKIVTPLQRPFTGNCHLDRDIEALIKEAGVKIEKLERFHERFKPLTYHYQGVASKER